jgi:hypothetical protein
MSRRAIVQIGTEKTGTTTLQLFLSTNRAKLAQGGFLYPRFCGALNHTGLAAFALDPAKRDAIRGPFGGLDLADVPAMRERLRRAAAAELAGTSTAIFCSEHCHSRLTTAAEVDTLRGLLAEFFDDVQISVYLRRQDQVALSLYSTRLKSGAVDRTILPRTNAEDPYFNYDRSLALWENGFGRANVHVRLFDRQALVGGSVVGDFLAAWRLGAPEAYTPVPDQNESIRPAAQEFLRLVNAHLEPIAGLPIEEVRGPLAARLAKLLPGRGARPGRAEAEAFYALFRSSNEAVRARYFPERESLFDEDFTAYPEVAEAREIRPEDVAAIAARLHVSATREARRLEAEIAIREARLHWARDERTEAEQALRRALKWCPDHAESHRTMAEYMLRLDRLDEAIAAATRAAELRGNGFEYWHFLGVLLRRARDFEGAAQAQRRALALNPAHAASRHELEQVLVKLADAAARAGSQPIRTNGSDPCARPLSA